MRLSAAMLAAALLLPQLAVRAQEKPNGPPSYKVEFNIQEGAKGSRHYTLLTDSNRKAVFKAGNRVPVASGSTEYTYLDIGANIECIVGEMNSKLTLHGSLDLSTVAPVDPSVRSGNSPNPTVVQTKVTLDTGIELGKPTVIASIDDPASARQFQVEATVTRIN